MHNPGEATITAANAARLTRAWTSTWANAGGSQRPTVVGGVVFYLHQHVGIDDPRALVAASARTGKTLWQVPLSYSNDRLYKDGVTVAGNLVLISFQQPRGFGAGLLAVDTRTRRIVWTTTVTDAAQQYGWSGHLVYADATRAYVHVADRTLGAYRLTDGRLQWEVPVASKQGIGLALGAGVLYVGYHDEALGITAYDAATGRKLWTGPGHGTPVVAGGRVFAESGLSVVALDAAGCGRATCSPLWRRTFPSGTSDLTLGPADGSTLFVTYRRTAPLNADGDVYASVLARLSASTGAQQWVASAGDTYVSAVRAGSVVWVVNSYRTASGTRASRILGYAATGTRTSPVANIPATQRGVPQTIVVGGGTLFNQTHIPAALVAYRVPGT
jgi:outer membrane protein assembly factor BamB